MIRRLNINPKYVTYSAIYRQIYYSYSYTVNITVYSIIAVKRKNAAISNGRLNFRSY